jgi:phosphatidylglycerol:prolipoprotein diacylglycerol transferase
MHPTLIEIFGFQISTFGVMLAVAFLVGGWMVSTSLEQSGISSDVAWRLLTWAMVGGIVGSKLWFAVEAVARSPGLSFFEPLFARGGITWYGGLVGGAILVLAVAHRARIPLILTMNVAAPALAIGQAIGRLGCFLVGDDYGRSTDVPWGIAFPEGIDPISEPVHPTQLYEFAWLGVGGLALWLRRGRSPFLFAEYLLLQGIGRLWLEAFRTNPAALGPLTNAQVAALCCVLAGVAGWVWAFRQGPRPLGRTPPA